MCGAHIHTYCPHQKRRGRKKRFALILETVWCLRRHKTEEVTLFAATVHLCCRRLVQRNGSAHTEGNLVEQGTLAI